ncbi:MAG: cytochrome P450 [Oculatellaceae cyanobacterium Prado106]|jgi:unspecific monooxygenase|nr:cytochrome P450 [Oculatellaceae cyanobacterium Prado106]
MKYPPFVEDHPQIQLLKWTFWPIEFLEDCAKRYGDCFVVRFGNVKPSVFFSHPDAIAELFSSTHAEILDSGRAQPMLKMVLGKHSTILLDGQEHRRHRQLITPPLHGERMRTYGEIISQITEQVTQDWQPGKSIVLHSYLSDITFKVIVKTIFGLRETERDQSLGVAVRKFLDAFKSPLLYYLAATLPILQADLGPWSPGGNYQKQIQKLDQLMFAMIQDHRKHLNPAHIDMLTMLMLATDETGASLSDVELRDELLSLLFAGYDTSSTVTSWAFYYIHANPAVKARLLEELDRLGDNPSPSEIVKLPYLSAVCSESLRMRSAVPSSTPRINKAPICIQGYEFPPESQLVPAQHLTHHRPDLYPDPYRFNPDRFLNHPHSPSEFYPYGGGARFCAGAAFAGYQMKLIVATILPKYQLELAHPGSIKTMRRGVNIAPKGGVKMVLKQIRVPAQKKVPLGLS